MKKDYESTNPDFLLKRLNEAKIDISELWTAVNMLCSRTAKLEHFTKIDESSYPKDNIKLFFGDALRIIMRNDNIVKRMTRTGWNNKDVYVYVANDDAINPNYLMVKTLHGHFVPWSPTHQELMAMDWMILE